jgi:hypothetical protein
MAPVAKFVSSGRRTNRDSRKNYAEDNIMIDIGIGLWLFPWFHHHHCHY